MSVVFYQKIKQHLANLKFMQSFINKCYEKTTCIPNSTSLAEQDKVWVST